MRLRLPVGRDGDRQPALRLGRVFGIQLTASWSWLLLVALLVYVAGGLFRSLRLDLPPPLLPALAATAAVLAVASLYAHEVAHALVARRFGIPVRTVSLFLLGGMAHITRESPSPRAEFLIAVSGPAASLGIGLLGALVGWLAWDAAPALGALGWWLAMLNVPLAVFNLVPAFPLDGGRVLRAVLWLAGQDVRWASTVAARAGQAAALAVLFAGVYLVIETPVNALNGLWLILVAWFMYAGAASGAYAAVIADVLRRLPVAAVMDRRVGRVEADATLQTFVEAHLLSGGSAVAANGAGGPAASAWPGDRAPTGYAVYRGEVLVGLLAPRRLARVPVQTWAITAVERAMQPIEATPSLAPEAPAVGALNLLLEEGCEQVAVVAEGRLLGLVTRADLARAAAAG